MMKITKIWTELEADTSLQSGLLLRRLPLETDHGLYLAVKRPEQFRCVAVRFRATLKLDTRRYANLKDIKVTVISDDADKSMQYLLVALTNSDHAEVFSSLVEDLITEVLATKTDAELVRSTLNRLSHWAALFEKAESEGLTSEEQLGLYGELYLLRKWVRSSLDAYRCVASWFGPDRELRDFQIEGIGIEVKSTKGSNHGQIRISNERQLDISKISCLYLYHLVLERQPGNGETLNAIIESVKSVLECDYNALEEFKLKLVLAGYFQHHVQKYDSHGYQLRRETFYEVNSDFPRIEESDLRSGVSETSYTVSAASISQFAIPETSVLKKLKENEGTTR